MLDPAWIPVLCVPESDYRWHALCFFPRPQTDKDIPKKKKKLEADLMALTRDFSFRVRGVTGVLTFVALFGVYRMITAKFGGIAVAKLPFHPPHLMRRMTHSSLEGEDFLECSAMFIYMLCERRGRWGDTIYHAL